MIYEWSHSSDIARWIHLSGEPAESFETWCDDWKAHYFTDESPRLGRAFVIELDGRPIGVVAYNDIDEQDRVELDIWMDSETHCGRGFGTDAIEALCSHLSTALGVKTFMVQPSARNPRAIRAYEKTGFVRTPTSPEEFQAQWGRIDCHDSVLMIRIDCRMPGTPERTVTQDAYRLIDPTENLADEYIAYVEEFRAAGEPFVHGDLAAAGGSFAQLLQCWRDWADGRNLPAGYVPGNHYWLVRGRRIIGTSRFRHQLTKALEDEGGHIGYDVRPSERGKGNATRLLAMTMERARRLGLHRVLVTCNADNPASKRVIEKCGGQLASRSPAERTGKEMLRYWIDLSKQ